MATKYILVRASKTFTYGEIGVNTDGYVLVCDSTGTPSGILEYDLKQEVVLPYTQAQITALANLAKARSYLGTTHIYSTDETSPNIDVTYCKSTQIVIDDILTRVEELEGGE